MKANITENDNKIESMKGAQKDLKNYQAEAQKKLQELEAQQNAEL